jgi:hypothetical protein
MIIRMNDVIEVNVSVRQMVTKDFLIGDIKEPTTKVADL